jgi:hypothetical protein
LNDYEWFVGVSGTQDGATPAQYDELRQTLALRRRLGATTLGHGDCVGVDAQAHEIGRELGYRIEVFPPKNPRKRAWCDGDVVHEPDDYLPRDRALVDRATEMFFLPKTPERASPRSGTWYTFRYTRRVQKPAWVIVAGRYGD